MPMPLKIRELAVAQCGRYNVAGRWLQTRCRCQRVNRIHAFWQELLAHRVGRRQDEVHDAATSQIKMALAFIYDTAESLVRLESMWPMTASRQGVFHSFKQLQALMATGMAWIMTMRLPISWKAGRQMHAAKTTQDRLRNPEVEHLMWLLNGLRHRLEMDLMMLSILTDPGNPWQPPRGICNTAVSIVESLQFVHRFLAGESPLSTQYATGRMVPTRRFDAARSWIYHIRFSDCGRQYLGSTSRLTRPGEKKCSSARPFRGQAPFLRFVEHIFACSALAAKPTKQKRQLSLPFHRKIIAKVWHMATAIFMPFVGLADGDNSSLRSPTVIRSTRCLAHVL